MFDFDKYPVLANIGLFSAAAFAIWRSGVKLEHYSDAIAKKTGIGHILGGILLLAVATSLPEIATTVSASMQGNVTLAANNLFGGIWFQMAVLAASDFVLRQGALTYLTPSYGVLLQGVALMLLISLALVGLLTSVDVKIFLGLGAWTSAIFIVYVGIIFLLYRMKGHARWQPAMSEEEKGEIALSTDQQGSSDEEKQKFSLSLLFIRFGSAAAIVLVAGWLIANVSDALSQQLGLSHSFVGGVLVAFSTSLPEVSTTFAAMRNGRPTLGISNVLGTNCLNVALIFLIDVVHTKGLVIESVTQETAFNASLGALLTAIFLVGLLERRNTTIKGIGVDSWFTLAAFAGGLIIFYARWGSSGPQ
ncbi:MAG: sodium:calcium antiporter [Deltaproteobacteria bacterium]|nr:sodium:calcium antiporter [Deltaproteobacteria bacterium]